jgi:uncharacterized membrane protein YfcA
MTVIAVAGIILLATVFRTLFGFGEALIAVPLLALFMPVKLATPIAVLVSIVIAGFTVMKDWKHIHFASAGRLILSTLVGLPIGLFLLKNLPELIVKLVLALIILAISLQALLFPKKSISLRNDRWAWIFGFFAGVFGGSYGMNGPPLALYGALRKWQPENFRATLQGYFLPASFCGMLGYAWSGLWTSSVNYYFCWSLPVVIVGIFIGRRLASRFSAYRFIYFLHFGLLFVALLLLLQSFI